MFDHKLFRNDKIELYNERNQVFIKVMAEGFSVADFNNVSDVFPRVKVTDFVNLKKALDKAEEENVVKIGEMKPLVEVSISKDKLEAYALILLTEEEFRAMEKKVLMAEVLKASNEAGIIYGQDINDVITHMRIKEPFCIATGKAPIDGDDAVIRMYELQEAAPELYQDGKVNHYELNLINTVGEGAWLGERVEPTVGVDGVSVLGTAVQAKNGRQEQLKYDPKSVRVKFEEARKMTFLYAKRSGAVAFMKGRVAVSNYLDIDGDVSFRTGNIDFEGFVDISNTVDDNFSVKADDDIQVKGDMGIGGIELIESRNGNIYIRGGIAGKHKAVVRCHGNLYTKFAADCTIECTGTVNIGFYALNANIKAKEVILEADNSKIIGGVIEAQARVLVGELGSRANVYTKIKLEGFDRKQIENDFKLIDSGIEASRHKMDKAKAELGQFGIELSEREREKQQAKDEEYNNYKEKVESLQKHKETYLSYLQAKGEGEVVVKKHVHSNVSITIKDDKFISTEEINLPVTFYYDDYELKQD